MDLTFRDDLLPGNGEKFWIESKMRQTRRTKKDKTLNSKKKKERKEGKKRTWGTLKRNRYLIVL